MYNYIKYGLESLIRTFLGAGFIMSASLYMALASPILMAGGEFFHGQAAIDMLGERLPDVAREKGMTAERLKEIFLRDSTLHVSATGELLYIDAGMAAGLKTPSLAMTAALDNTVPLDSAFMLHSKAGAPLVVYLDFNGETVQNTAWNTAQFGPCLAGSPIVGAPFSTDADLAFSDTEKAAIIEMWKRVAEDYAPFEVDVTTEDPGVDSLLKTGSKDMNYGVRVLVAGNICGGSYDAGVGGITYLGSFDVRPTRTAPAGYYQPSWVFANAFSFDTHFIAEAISHEAGHSLSLHHDGLLGATEYFVGFGSGLTGWAPIMGLGYYQPLSQWSRGEYRSASNIEDDTGIIASHVPLSVDMQGGDVYTASILPIQTDPLDVQRAVFLQDSIIETMSDRDVFAVWAGTGVVNVDLSTLLINSTFPGTNLDAAIRVLDATGAVVATANLPGAQGESLSFVSDTDGKFYFVEINGVSYLSPLTEGYSEYGSLGQYRIGISFPKSTQPVGLLPKLPKGKK